MKIVFLATGVFDKGGISRYSRYQIRALQEILGESQVYSLSLLGPGCDDFEEPFCIQYHGNGTNWPSKVAFMWAVVRSCFLLRPSAIWCNHLNLLPLGLTARALLATARLVVNVYGLELWSNRQWLHRYTLPKPDLIVSDCHFSAKFVEQHYGIPPEHLRVVWDCVDTKRFQPKPRRDDLLRAFGVPVGSEYRYILTLGRISTWSHHKGYDRLLDVMRTLQEYPCIIALFAGDGNDRARLEQRARNEGLAGRVFFLGSVPENLLVDVYNLCHVFVLVSDRGYGRGEGIPLTPLEAASCGKPIIVGNEDGSQEAVIDGVNGRIVSPGDTNALRQAILDILLNDEMRERMGEDACDRIKTEFSYEGFREKIERILDELGEMSKISGRDP